MQDPSPDRDDQAGLLGERDEVGGRDDAVAAVPAQEGFNADDALVCELDDRLVHEHKLVLRERAFEL